MKYKTFFSFDFYKAETVKKIVFTFVSNKIMNYKKKHAMRRKQRRKNTSGYNNIPVSLFAL